MAIPSNAVWEYRPTGAGNNGGFFNPSSGGTDYSQQDAPQLALADAATDAAGTGLSSATGGFTAAMVGNGVHLTGGGVTAGHYEIVSVTDSNSVVLDRSAGASRTGATARVGGAWLPTTYGSWRTAVPGNTIWIRAGTYTTNQGTAIPAGTAALRTHLIGYNAARGDNPAGEDRPLLAVGQYNVGLENCTSMRFLRWTGTIAQGCNVGNYCLVRDCLFYNYSATAGRPGATGGINSVFADCEMFSDHGPAFTSNSSGWALLRCRLHDSPSGVRIGTSATHGTALHCEMRDCPIGVENTTATGLLLLSCIICNATTAGVRHTTAAYARVLNNILHTCAVGIDADSGNDETILEDWNCFWNNATDRNNCRPGANSFAADPQFADPANDDFTIGAGAFRESCLMRILPGTADQPAAGGGGGTRVYVGA